MILPNPKYADIDVIKFEKDNHGRLIVLDTKMNGANLVLMNLYAPNDIPQQVEFFEKVLSLPQSFSKRVGKTTLDFIWDSKPHKIKTNTLIGDRNVGGLKMSEFESMNKALKASWLRRFLIQKYRSGCAVENHPKLHDSTPTRF